MNHLPGEAALIAQIERDATTLGLHLEPQVGETLRTAAEWLAKLAQSSGISGYGSAAEALERGIMPALSYFQFPEAPRNGRLADLGAGAGALGAGIAILGADLQVSLVDRARRSLTACELLAARLKLPNLAVVEMNLGLDGGSEALYDAVVFRALAPGSDALALACGVVRVGGFIAAYHREGDPVFAEVGNSLPEARLKRLRAVATGVEGLQVTGFEVMSCDSQG